MEIPSQPVSQLETPPGAESNSVENAGLSDPAMPLLLFLERKFIPNHVEFKSEAGRTHYHAIMKHILRPETVDCLFAPYMGKSKGRLKAAIDWPYLDDIRLCDLNAHHVQQLTFSATARGYSPQTVKHIKNVISAIFSHAQKERLLTGENPMKAVKLPPLTHKKPHSISIAQAREVLRLMQHPEREMALLTISSGMSVSEMCALRWKHINLTSVPIHSEGNTVAPGSIVIRKPSATDGVTEITSGRDREIALPEPLIKILITLKRHNKNTDPDNFIFTNGDGNPIHPTDIRLLRLKRIGRELDMPWLSWQVLRRAHEAWLNEIRSRLAADLVPNA